MTTRKKQLKGKSPLRKNNTEHQLKNRLFSVKSTKENFQITIKKSAIIWVGDKLVDIVIAILVGHFLV